MRELPLHVRVAEALGWNELALMQLNLQAGPIMHIGEPHWRGVAPGKSSQQAIPQYDTDWSAIGPLIEEHLIHVSPCHPSFEKITETPWLAQKMVIFGEQRGPYIEMWPQVPSYGSTPLIAICNLIIKLKELGKF